MPHIWRYKYTKSNNNNNQDNVYGAVIMSHWESTPGSCDKCRTAPDGCRPLDQAIGPPVGSYRKLHPPSPFIITQPESWYTFNHPTEGRRLSQLRRFTCPQAVTHPSRNWAQCRLTMLIEANALTTTLCCHPSFMSVYNHSFKYNMSLSVQCPAL